ncbi:MAG: outer membrane protein assembly factor BamD [Candidatus Aminicenantes bacterium]|nr:outer membrane protein assembly factor BamD [Candidatus Aminicenantes bacterium]
MILNEAFSLKNKCIILFILATTYILLVSFGCATFILSAKNIEIRKHLSLAKKLSKQAKYEQALRENEMILEKHPENPWQDEVLFNLACLYAYYDNPQKDYNKAIIYFQRLIKEFPQSSYQKESNLWLAILGEILSKERKTNNLRDEINSLKKEKIEIQSSMSQEILLKEQEIKKLEKKIHIQEIAIDLLQAQIKKIKEVDIQLEKKRRK